jgi:Domain of unknown function (DUF6794)
MRFSVGKTEWRTVWRQVAFWVSVPVLLPAFYFFEKFIQGTRLEFWWQSRRWPKTIDEAVEKLIASLSNRDKELIRNRPTEVDWYSFGQGVRNGFGLWKGNKELIESCGVSQTSMPEDAASGAIIARLIQRLTEMVTATENTDRRK